MTRLLMDIDSCIQFLRWFRSLPRHCILIPFSYNVQLSHWNERGFAGLQNTPELPHLHNILEE